MSGIGSVLRHITGKHARPPSEADLAAAAITAHPPAQLHPDDPRYRELFVRLADTAQRSYRERKPLHVTVTPDERQIVAAELGQIVAAITLYLRTSLALRNEPHLQLSMHPLDRGDAIEVRVSF